MTGKQLKEAIARIPDDATVLVAGPDCGGYDWQRCSRVFVLGPWEGDLNEENGDWLVVGDERD